MDDQFHILIDKLWDESITEAEQEELQLLLSRHPELGGEAAEELQLKGMLSAVLESPESYVELSDKVSRSFQAEQLPAELEKRIMQAVVSTQEQPSVKMRYGSSGAQVRVQPRIYYQKKRRPFIPLSLVACLIIGIGVAFFMMSSKESLIEVATVQEVSGNVGVERGGERIFLSNGDRILAQDVLAVGGEVSLLLDDGSLLTIQPGSKLGFTEFTEKKVVTLLKGAMECAIEPQDPKKPLTIKSPNAFVEVIGTEFTFSYLNRDTGLVMKEGVVSLQVEDRAQKVLIAEGEQAKVKASGSLSHTINRPVYQFKKGTLSVEAEHFHRNDNKGSIHWWQYTDSDKKASMASGGAYMEALPDQRVRYEQELIPGEGLLKNHDEGPRLSYKVNFPAPGNYFLWCRAITETSEDNSVNVSVDKFPAIKVVYKYPSKMWEWSSLLKQDGSEKAILTVPAKGVYTIHFSMREDGLKLDKWILTRDPNFSGF